MNLKIYRKKTYTCALTKRQRLSKYTYMYVTGVTVEKKLDQNKAASRSIPRAIKHSQMTTGGVFNTFIHFLWIFLVQFRIHRLLFKF